MGNWKGGIKKQTYKNRLLHQKHQLHDTSIGNLRGLEHKQNNDCKYWEEEKVQDKCWKSASRSRIFVKRSTDQS